MAILAELSTFSFFWPSTVFDPVLIDLFLSDVWPEVVVLILLITFELSLFDDPFSAVGTLSKIAKLDLFARHWMSCAYYAKLYNTYKCIRFLPLLFITSDCKVRIEIDL